MTLNCRQPQSIIQHPNSVRRNASASHNHNPLFTQFTQQNAQSDMQVRQTQ
jgi:hypothetical protein